MQEVFGQIGLARPCSVVTHDRTTQQSVQRSSGIEAARRTGPAWRWRWCARSRNPARVMGESPRSALAMVAEFCFSTPRIIVQGLEACSTRREPSCVSNGLRTSSNARRTTASARVGESACTRDASRSIPCPPRTAFRLRSNCAPNHPSALTVANATTARYPPTAHRSSRTSLGPLSFQPRDAISAFAQPADGLFAFNSCPEPCWPARSRGEQRSPNTLRIGVDPPPGRSS